MRAPATARPAGAMVGPLALCLAAGLISTGLYASAVAAVYYVDQKHPSASDANPGTEAAPWRTINKGTQTAAAGDTVIVKEGIYREAPSLKNSGVAGSPITLKGAAGHRAVVSGADEITGWAQCTAAIAKQNPNYARIYYADILWKPSRLVQDETSLEKAREPNVGWWVAQGGTTLSVVDPVNLTQPTGFWVGGEIFFWDVSVTSQYTRQVVGYDQATRTLTVDQVWYSDRVPEAGKDRYFLLNKVEIIDREGEWAVEDIGGGRYRVYVWPLGGGNPSSHLMEGSRRSRFVIELGSRSYWVIENLELRHGQGHGVGCWSSGSLGHNTVLKCCIHHNDGTGIYGRYNEGGLYRRNFIAYNGAGILVSDRGNVVIEENEVADNLWDGLNVNGSGTIVRRNYIHGHWIWGHADNLQTWGGITDLLIEDNLVINGGQDYMMEGCDGVAYRGNTILGSNAYMLIFGHGTTFNITLDFNTLCWPGYGLISMTGTGYHLRNNICVKGHSGTMWGSGPGKDYLSDYNLFWHADGMVSYPVVWDGHYNYTLAQYAAASGQDTHSVYANPQFANAPAAYYQLAFGRNNDFRQDGVYINNSSSANMALLAVGDRVEIDFDGVARTVTAKGADWVEVAPGSERLAFKYGCMLNWKAKEDFALDLTPAPGSPAIGAADDGSDLGSRINMRQYMSGDFDGDGARDVPSWPPPVSQVLKWEVVLAHGGAGDLAVEAAEGYIEPRVPGVRKLRLSFSHPLDPASLGPASIGIVGQAGGDVSALVAQLALENEDRTLVVTLSEKLPDGDRYTMTVKESVQGVGGTAVGGAKSRQIAALAGDVDGSGDVTQADVVSVRGRLGQVVAPEAPWYDLDCSGAVTAADMIVARRLVGRVLP